MEWEWREKGESTGHKGCLEEEEKCELLSIWRKVWKINSYMMLWGGRLKETPLILSRNRYEDVFARRC